jgi:LmbE family N-acetylglucosaminyl deacetylase
MTTLAIRTNLRRCAAILFLSQLPLLLSARTVIVVPHPDDESIGMAGTIREKVVAGEETWVMLMTHGEASGVYTLLNGARHCGLHNRIHNPVEEGFLPADLDTNGLLTRTGFGNARVREFHGSLDQLGHPMERRRVFNYGDGQVSLQVAGSVWQSLFEEFGPDTDYFTVQNEMDTVHKDHQNLSNALRDNTSIPDSRKTFYAVYEFADNTHPNGAGALNPKSIAPYQEAKNRAMGQYRLWQPTQGRYCVGEHSTPSLIINSSNWDYEYPYRLLTSAVNDWALF